MFFKAIAFVSLAIFAAAHPKTTTVTETVGPTATTVSQCNVSGGPQCCNSVVTASDPAAAVLLDSLGILVTDPSLLVGLTCSAINIAAPNCAQQPVCCDHNDWNGLINIGCVSISL